MMTVQGRPTEIPELRKFLHDVANALNAAKINAYLLKHIHGEALDREAINGLDSSLLTAERLLSVYHTRVHAELTERGSANLESDHDKATQ